MGTVIVLIVVGCKCNPIAIGSGTPATATQADTAKATSPTVVVDTIPRGAVPSSDDEKIVLPPEVIKKLNKNPEGNINPSVSMAPDRVPPRSEEERRRWFVEDSISRVKLRSMPPTKWGGVAQPKTPVVDSLKGK